MVKPKKSPAMNEVLKTLHRINKINVARWSPEKIRATYGNRKVSDVLASNEVNYQGSCLDRSMATSVLLNEKGFNPTLVIHEHIPKGEHNPAIHFGVEVPIEDELHTIGYKSGKHIVVYKGDYNPKISRPEAKSLKIHRFDARKLNRDSTLLSFFGQKSLKDLTKISEGIDRKHVEAFFKRMDTRDSDEHFEHYKNVKPRVELI